MKTPVTFLIFNRPDTTEKVFQAIRQAKPPKLLVVADGPRSDRPGEKEKCAAARAIINGVDWECEVLINYSDVNLGCKKRVSSGLDWVFDTVEESIILEDDCLPNPSFFLFCEELLERYREDNRIAVISGQNVQFGHKRTHYSYYFSRYNHCWGWASWRRAWQNFDYDMQLWPLIKENGWLKDILKDEIAVKYWTKIFQDTYDDKTNSWAYRWTFSCWTQNHLSILSNINLISNIGFAREATNTKKDVSIFSKIPTEEIYFPLKHPPFIVQDVESDDFTQRTLYCPPLINRINTKIKNIYSDILGVYYLIFMFLKQLILKGIKKSSNFICMALGRDNITFTKIFPRNDLVELGTKYGGWIIPKNLLDSGSIVYCVGCGEDISFDLSLIDKVGCNILGFDPTPRAIQYVKKVTINNTKYHFNEVGLWDKDDVLKFYAPKNSDHVSHSLLNLQRTSKYFEAKVKRLSTIMQEHNHKKIDLLKLDIEGAEYKVINSIIEDELDIKIICVEYDEYFNPLDSSYKLRIKQSINKLVNAGFSLVCTQGNGNYTFVKR